MATKTQEQYVAEGGMHCPACNSCEFIGGSIEVAAGTAIQEVTCCDCEATWHDQYKLTGFVLVEE